jgi:hypothetical protein
MRRSGCAGVGGCRRVVRVCVGARAQDRERECVKERCRQLQTGCACACVCARESARARAREREREKVCFKASVLSLKGSLASLPCLEGWCYKALRATKP